MATGVDIKETGHLKSGDVQSSSEEWLLLRVGSVPRNSLGWFRCGVGFYNKKEYVKSIECFEKSVALDPMNYNAFQIMARACIAVNRKEDAIAALKQSVILDNPSDWQVATLGRINSQQGLKIVKYNLYILTSYRHVSLSSRHLKHKRGITSFLDALPLDVVELVLMWLARSSPNELHYLYTLSNKRTTWSSVWCRSRLWEIAYNYHYPRHASLFIPSSVSYQHEFQQAKTMEHYWKQVQPDSVPTVWTPVIAIKWLSSVYSPWVVGTPQCDFLPRTIVFLRVVMDESGNTMGITLLHKGCAQQDSAEEIYRCTSLIVDRDSLQVKTAVAHRVVPGLGLYWEVCYVNSRENIMVLRLLDGTKSESLLVCFLHESKAYLPSDLGFIGVGRPLDQSILVQCDLPSSTLRITSVEEYPGLYHTLMILGLDESSCDASMLVYDYSQSTLIKTVCYRSDVYSIQSAEPHSPVIVTCHLKAVVIWDRESGNPLRFCRMDTIPLTCYLDSPYSVLRIWTLCLSEEDDQYRMVVWEYSSDMSVKEDFPYSCTVYSHYTSVAASTADQGISSLLAPRTRWIPTQTVSSQSESCAVAHSLVEYDLPPVMRTCTCFALAYPFIFLLSSVGSLVLVHMETLEPVLTWDAMTWPMLLSDEQHYYYDVYNYLDVERVTRETASLFMSKTGFWCLSRGGATGVYLTFT